MRILCMGVTLVLFLSGLTQAQPKDEKLAKVIALLEKSFKNKDYLLLEPTLDQSFVVGEFSRPKADKVMAQLVMQVPTLIGFEIEDVDVSKDKIIVEINWEVKGGHGQLWGNEETTSKCVLTKDYKYVSIEYFDFMLSKAVRR